jgi:methylthioribulose-1-phosphate dehydratase
MSVEQILVIDENARVISHSGTEPSAETHLHLRIVGEFGAGAVLHTHSVWSTTLSDIFAAEGGLSIEGYEMLKGLAGVQTHEHREWLPVIENSQDMLALSETVGKTLRRLPETHGFLLRRHGLYTWGKDLNEANRHVEILEFLLEATGRTRFLNRGGN